MRFIRRKRSEKKVFKVLRRVFFTIRLVCLFLLVGIAYQLVRWSHDYDPRFYQFLGTAPGKALSNFMEWPNLYNRVQKEKPLSEYSLEEKDWHDRILTRIQQSWPSHTLVYKDGRQKHVRIVQTTSKTLTIRENLGFQGWLETQVPAQDLKKISRYEKELPHISLRDVRFQMSFPDFHLSYSGPYTVLTDAPYFQVADSVKTLEKLHHQYVEIFRPLIRFPNKEQSLQVLFFSSESDYRAHQNDTAPELSTSVGFYSPLEDRMVVFNQQYSDRAKLVRKDVDDDIAELLQLATTASQRQQILKMQHRAEAQIRDRAQLETIATLRHEGAHHLSYSYGVHSWIHTENGWLIEGLASYFESATPGEPDPVYLETLMYMAQENRIPALSALVEIRQPEDFTHRLPGLEAHEAYALSWSLFHFCMGPENREAFFEYLGNLQNPGDIGSLMNSSRTDLLAKYLGVDSSTLEKAWLAHLQSLLSESS